MQMKDHEVHDDDNRNKDKSHDTAKNVIMKCQSAQVKNHKAHDNNSNTEDEKHDVSKNILSDLSFKASDSL
jgi:hypothetical protein